MKLNYLSLLLLFFIVSSGFSQKRKDVLLTIDEQPVYASEFKTVFKKNLDLVIDESQKSVDGYLDLFIDYKLKVAEAYAQGLDKDKSYIKEITKYEDQLSKNYIYDKRVTSELVDEAYERGLEEINANHILILLPFNAKPSDSLIAYNKISSIREKAINGEDFEALTEEYSEEPSAKKTGGKLGYFSVFDMVYDFETAAYNTKVGKISEIVRTEFGYHIIMINDKRKKPHKLNVSHIMIFSNEKAIIENPEERINELYALLMQGESFESIAKQFSEDKSSAIKGGEIKTFGLGNLRAPIFETAAYSIAEEGDILAPIESSFGWHIIRLNKKIMPLSFEESKSELESKVNAGSRAKVVTQAVNNKIKAKYGYQDGESYLPYFGEYVTDSVLVKKWSYIPVPENKNKVLFTIGDLAVKYDDFGEYISIKQKKAKGHKNKEELLNDFYIQFKNESIENYFKFKLEGENEEYASIIGEYRNGLLIFDVMNKNIWAAAKTDSIGFQDYYEATKNNYKWEQRVDVDIVSATKESVANDAKKLLQEGMTIDDIKGQLNTDETINVIITSGIFEVDKRELPENFEVKKGVSELYDVENSKVVVNVKKVLEPTIKELDEVKGLVMSNFQTDVEKKWMQELHGKYQVVVNKKTLKKVKKELDK